MNGNNDIWFRRRNPEGDFGYQASLLRVAAVFAFALFVASHLPPVLIAPMMQKILFLGALAAVTIGVLLQENPLAPVFTRWDEAAALYLMSWVAAAFVDVQGAAAAIAELRGDGGVFHPLGNAG